MHALYPTSDGSVISISKSGLIGKSDQENEKMISIFEKANAKIIQSIDKEQQLIGDEITKKIHKIDEVTNDFRESQKDYFNSSEKLDNDIQNKQK